MIVSILALQAHSGRVAELAALNKLMAWCACASLYDICWLTSHTNSSRCAGKAASSTYITCTTSSEVVSILAYSTCSIICT